MVVNNPFIKNLYKLFSALFSVSVALVSGLPLHNPHEPHHGGQPAIKTRPPLPDSTTFDPRAAERTSCSPGI